MNKNLKKRKINKIADQLIWNIFSIYKTILYIYICEMLAFAFFVICEHEGVISPTPYKNMFEAFYDRNLQTAIWLISMFIGGIYKMVKTYFEGPYFLNFICFIVVGILINANQLNFISIQQLYVFTILSTSTLVVVAILYVIRQLTFVPDNQGVVKPMDVVPISKNKNEGEEK